MATIQPVYANATAQRFEDAMLLSAAGDAIGFYNGSWEFNYSSSSIHEEAKAINIEKTVITLPKWNVSDDTVMHMATAKALLAIDKKQFTSALWRAICDEYVKCYDDMGGRAPGPTCLNATADLRKYQQVPYSGAGGGCGAAMRTMCIGLALHKENELDDLIAIAIEAGRCTHNHPTGFLGSVVSALFTSYAVRGVPLLQWGYKFVAEVYPKCLEYMKKDADNWDYYYKNNEYFINKWYYFLEQRGLNRPDATQAVFPKGFVEDVKVRDTFYTKKLSYSGWAGSSGHDAVLIAYDALIGSQGDWLKFLYWGVLHGGDNDSTGAIGAAWFGTLYGTASIPKNHYEQLEFHDELCDLAQQMFIFSQM
jgi:ADP-ribosylarginine hydrolase